MLTTVLTLSILSQSWSTAVTTKTGGSCAVQSTSRIETLLNPTSGSDERFFARPNGAPNILFLIDTSAGAMGWANGLPTATGCADSSFAPGYDPTIGYEPVVKKVDATGWPGSTGDYNDKWFEYGRIYDMPADANYGDNLKDDPASVVADWSDAADACDNPACDTACNTAETACHGGCSTAKSGCDTACAGDATCLTACSSTKSTCDTACNTTETACHAACTTTEAACATCLNTKGFYRGTVDGSTRTVAKGNFLNFYGPKYVAVSQVLSQLVRDVQNVRFGILTSHKWDSKEWSDGSGSDPLVNMSMMETFWPSCSKSFDSSKKFHGTDTTPQRNSVLNNISNDSNADFTGDNMTSTMLYGAGWYYGSRNPWPPGAFPSSSTWPAPDDNSGTWKEGSSNQKSVCDACVYSAIIMVNASSLDETKDLKLTLPDFAKTIGGSPAPNCDASTNSKCNSRADELAAWLYRNDFRADYGGNQRVTTYVVNIHPEASTAEVLRNVARMGGGLYYGAQSNGDLKKSIFDAIQDISSRGQTFATSAVTSIQTGQVSLTQLVPRMYPQRNLPWTGELYRYAQRNEFVLDTDLNGDGDTSDVYVVDADNDVVIESSDGYFKKAGTYASLSSTLSDGGITADANPFWEVAKEMRTAGWAARSIWTVVDRDDTRGSFTQSDRMVEFKRANWTELVNTLGLTKNNCPNGSNLGGIFTKLNLSVSDAAAAVSMSVPTTDAQRWELCAKVMIDYVRGRDLADEDADSDIDETRGTVMADIFHSSPIVVEPPSERFICDLGISNQCTKTLYASSLPTAATLLDTSTTFPDPLCKQADNTTAIGWTDPYDIWRAKNRARDKVVVVGSNGGMLHVFNNGKITGTPTCSGVAWSGTWNEGTGKEEWAFIPPDLMPKLQDMVVNGHEYFVDGDLMVRDIWTDGSGASTADGKKQWDEYHTMVIAAEGRGGNHYFSLELVWKGDTHTAANRPIGNPITDSSVRPFRWIFPQPGTKTASKAGKTLFTLSPKPPPIGPVLLEYSGTGKVSRYGVDTRETWVTMLSGGWAPGLNRGRGIYMVDAFWGVVNGREDNLYWKAELDPAETSNLKGPTAAMSGSFASPVGMVDYGAHDAVVQDGFFDTAIVGDTVGQLWTVRFFKPGHLDDDSTSQANEDIDALGTQVPHLLRTNPGIVTNWSMARSFEMHKGATYSGSGSAYKDITNVQPFFYLPSVAIEPATLALRALIGTGNRYALLEDYSGNCRWDNPMACAKYGCTSVNVDLDMERSPSEIETQGTFWSNKTFDSKSADRLEAGSETRDYCTDTAEANYETYEIDDCDQESGGDKNYGQVNQISLHCGPSADYGFNCRRNSVSGDRNTGDLDFKTKISVANASGKDRYYGLWVYGGTRFFDETGVVASTPYAKTFDAARLTDRGGSGQGDLVNVSATDCPFNGACTGSVGTGNLGWFYQYTDHGMKTATGSAIISSCAVWSSLTPGSAIAGGTEACATSVASSGFFQADFITGEPNCAAGFNNPDGGSNLRYLTRSVLTPPPEPATIVQISTTGKIRYSAQLPEPGKGTQFQVDMSGGGDILQSVYELPVSRGTHNCRHNASGNCTPVP